MNRGFREPKDLDEPLYPDQPFIVDVLGWPILIAVMALAVVCMCAAFN